MRFRFLIYGRIGRLLLHLLVILGACSVGNEQLILKKRKCCTCFYRTGQNRSRNTFWNTQTLANAFVEQTKFKGEVYADPKHASYEALEFVSGVSVTFTPKAAMKIIESYMEGYRQDWKLSFMKDTVEKGGWQQGGILVAGLGKHNITYIRKNI